MKKISIIIFAAVAVLAGCNRVLIEKTGNGFLSFNLSAEGDFIDVDLTRAGANEDKNEFKVSIVSQNGLYSKNYERYSDMPSVIEIPSGTYTVKAQSPETLPAAFDQPVYGAEKKMVVKVGETTSEKLICTLQNVKISLSPSQSFLTELESYTISISNGNAVENMLFWTNLDSETESQYLTKDITKPGYFSVAPLTIRVDGKRISDGSEAYIEKYYPNVNARDHITITIDAKVAGSAGVQLEVDASVTPKEENVFIPNFNETPVPDDDEEETPGDTGEIPGGNTGGGNDDNGDDSGDSTGGEDNGIALVWTGNDSFETRDIVSGMSVDLKLTVPEGIRDFVITVSSDTPMFMFLVSNMTSNPADYSAMDQLESVQIDLINDPMAVEAMAADGIELPTGTNLTGKTYVEFALSNLVPMIPEMGGAGPDTYHTFNLKIADSKGNEKDWNLTFHVPAN